jgi:hypothetical protein
VSDVACVQKSLVFLFFTGFPKVQTLFDWHSSRSVPHTTLT